MLAEAAQALHRAGAEGLVPMPVFDAQGRKLGYREMVSDVDEPTLHRSAAHYVDNAARHEVADRVASEAAGVFHHFVGGGADAVLDESGRDAAVLHDDRGHLPLHAVGAGRHDAGDAPARRQP